LSVHVASIAAQLVAGPQEPVLLPDGIRQQPESQSVPHEQSQEHTKPFPSCQSRHCEPPPPLHCAESQSESEVQGPPTFGTQAPPTQLSFAAQLGVQMGCPLELLPLVPGPVVPGPVVPGPVVMGPDVTPGPLAPAPIPPPPPPAEPQAAPSATSARHPTATAPETVVFTSPISPSLVLSMSPPASPARHASDEEDAP
jgi:hypothetical protein